MQCLTKWGGIMFGIGTQEFFIIAIVVMVIGVLFASFKARQNKK
jgi:hypothetical protein